jgi:hypothetical protein
MAVSNLVAAASGKTMFRTTLTSGTSYTVPAGVTYLNVTLVGGGGGGAGGTVNANYGGTSEGLGGETVSSTLSATAGATIAYAIGAGGSGGSSAAQGSVGGDGGTTTFTGATSATGGGGAIPDSNSNISGKTGKNSAFRNGGSSAIQSASGGTGGSGCIIVEYWA